MHITKDEAGNALAALVRGAVRGDVLAGNPTTRRLFREAAAAWEAACAIDNARTLVCAEDVIERARRGHA